MTSRWRALALALLVAALTATAGCGEAPRPAAQRRVVVIGFDGLDAQLTERWMDEGRLPEFAKLRTEGHYQRLATTNPPQSPVAWASFATGHDPGEHGIFDFLRRAEGSYAPDFSIAEQTAPRHVLSLFGYSLPLDAGELRNRRRGTPFWLAVEAHGQRATVLRVPVTYPPDPVTRMLSGMGVPDLLGTQGTYTILATRPIAGAETGGRVLLSPIGDDGVVRTELPGPAHPLRPAAPPLGVPMTLRPDGAGAVLAIDGVDTPLEVGRWSPWIKVGFGFGIGSRIPGMLRAHLSEGFPRPLLYLSPIQVDPSDAAVAVTSPASYAADLEHEIGPYHTLGMPEETWALNQGHLGEQAWLDMVRTTLAEGEAMLYDALDRHDSELVVKVFVQTDRVSHMFWRGFDETHPLHAASSPLARGAIDWIYREADRVLGEVRRRLGPNDRLIVLSDHGFASFRRAVHLNRWLVDHGYLALLPGADPDQPLFAAVDWSKTRAYALGLNGIFINRRGREPDGIVDTKDVAALKAELRTSLMTLRDPLDDTAVFSAVYDADALYHGEHRGDAPDLVTGFNTGFRASWQTSLGAVPLQTIDDNRQAWSGDHCIDPSFVPGVLFSSFALSPPVGAISDLAPRIDAMVSSSDTSP